MTIDPKRLSETAKLVFSDDFATLSLWNGSTGTWDTKFPAAQPSGSSLSGNSEQEVYINHAYAPTQHIRPWSVKNGILTLRAEPAAVPLVVDLGGEGQKGTYHYTSGMISSFRSFSARYGYFEMRAQLPKGRGYWPAFWLLPITMAWPPEIDAMEVLGHEMTKLYTVVHTNQTGEHKSTGGHTIVPDLSLGFHNYGVDWQKDFIRWFFDGNEIFKAPTPSDLHQPMYLIANLAVGGSWPGMVDATTPFPGLMHIDYIRAYADQAAVVVPPVTPPAPTPVPPPAPPLVNLEPRVADLERRMTLIEKRRR